MDGNGTACRETGTNSTNRANNGATIVNSDFCRLLRSTAWATPTVYYFSPFLMHPVQCDHAIAQAGEISENWRKATV